MRLYRKIWAAALSVVLVCGCATPAYKDVFKDKPAYNAKNFTVSRDIIYQAALRSICGRNFIIEKEEQEKGFILAKRSFQRGKRTIILVLQASINSAAADNTMLYLNALETTERHYVSDRTRFFLWLVPLPGGGGKEGASVKEGERIIEDEEFYENFFVEIEAEAKKLRQAQALALETKASASKEVSAQKESAEEIINQETAVPEITSAEVIDAKDNSPKVSQENTFQGIPLQEETVPAEGNITSLPGEGI